jgi:hypothetical protein
MSCKIFAALVIAACSSSDDLVRQVDGHATMSVQLASPTDREVKGATVTWQLITSPQDSAAIAPGPGAVGVFTPDLRGAYLVDRWIHYGLSSDLTDEFAISVDGVEPSCNMAAVSGAIAGVAVQLDGSATTSAEHRDLTFRWRLSQRPAGSAATLVDGSSPIATLTPDVAGDYEVELDAFDGELWCNAPVRQTIHVP